ncbi:universal stress protein, partial [Streptomyces sp. NPDC002454]
MVRSRAHRTARRKSAVTARHPCDPAFRHGVVVGFDGSTSSER